MIFNELLYVALVPLAVAATIALVAPRLRLDPPNTWAVSIAIGYIAGQFTLGSRTGDALAKFLQPREAADWLPHAVLCALAVTILATLAPRTWNRTGFAFALLVTIGLPLRLLDGSAYDLRWTLAEKSAHIALLSAALSLTWLALASAREADHPRLRPVLLILVACAAAVVVALSGVFVYGELCGVLAAAITGVFIASRSQNLAGAAGVVTCSLGSLILLSCFYAELIAMNAALLLFAMMSAAGPMPTFFAPRRPWLKTAFRIAAAVLPAALALAQTFAANQAPTASSPYWQ